MLDYCMIDHIMLAYQGHAGLIKHLQYFLFIWNAEVYGLV